MSGDKAWKRVGAEWRDVLLVCRKCSRKLDGGFGPDGDQPLAEALRRSIFGDGKRGSKALRRTLGVVEVGCLDLCPKRAVVVVKGSAPGVLHLVPEGAGVVEIAERLRLGSDAVGTGR